MSETKTPWKKLQNKDYLGECDFLPGEEKTVTIASISTSEVIGDGGKKSTKPIIRFQEQVKPLIANTVNFKRMQKLFKSKYIEDWIGRQVILYGDPTVTFGKELVGGVRVKDELPVGSTTLCTECAQIITASGKFTAKQIMQSTTNTYGRALCWDCAKEAKEKHQAVHEADEKTAREAELQAFHAEALAEARDAKEQQQTEAADGEK